MKQNESNSSNSSPNGKRSRDPEDEVYIDNLHSHKRYLSEIMASSLNGLTVGDHPIPDNVIESPARFETNFYVRDEMSWQYSPMSEDSDDSRFCENTSNTCSSQPESLPTSPVSPYRYQRPLSAFPYNPSSSSYSSPSGSTIAGSQSRQRGSDSEGRFPSSPSDICHSADLRRAALLRSVQMRSQPLVSSSFESPNVEDVEAPCLYMKSVAEERDDQIEECSPLGESEPEFSEEKTLVEAKRKTEGDDLGLNVFNS